MSLTEKELSIDERLELICELLGGIVFDLNSIQHRSEDIPSITKLFALLEKNGLKQNEFLGEFVLFKSIVEDIALVDRLVSR